MLHCQSIEAEVSCDSLKEAWSLHSVIPLPCALLPCTCSLDIRALCSISAGCDPCDGCRVPPAVTTLAAVAAAATVVAAAATVVAVAAMVVAAATAVAVAAAAAVAMAAVAAGAVAMAAGAVVSTRCPTRQVSFLIVDRGAATCACHELLCMDTLSDLGMLMHTAWPVRILRGVLLCGIGNGDYGGGYGGGGGGKQQIQL